MLLYLVAFAIILILFYRRINTATEPPEYIEAREQGTPAPAKVLSIERTRWRIERYRNLRFQVRPTRFEYVMRVRVRPEGGPEYESELAAYLSGADTPYKGDTIQVKIHPQRPDVLVFDKRYSDKIGDRGARRP